MTPQCQMLLDYLQQHGSVTGLQALIELGIMNYKGRIHDLRKLGYTIRTDYITRMNAHGDVKTFAQYTLKGNEDRAN